MIGKKWPGAWPFLYFVSAQEMQRGHVACETPREWCVALLRGTPEPTICSQQGFLRHRDSLAELGNLVDGVLSEKWSGKLVLTSAQHKRGFWSEVSS